LLESGSSGGLTEPPLPERPLLEVLPEISSVRARGAGRVGAGAAVP
jgi:hypothetical protein